MNESKGIFAQVGDDILFQPLIKTSGRYYIFLLFLLSLIGWGAYAYYSQVDQGLGVTGLNRPIFWGVYLTNFVFFIGISHAGTLISAILRCTNAEWRRPITRAAEAITVFALCIGAPQVLLDLGRIDRLPNVLLNAQFQSPLLWDVCCITTYLVGSITYLFLPMIPDLAMCRDRLPQSMPLRKVLCTILAMGWKGTPKQAHALEKTIGFMAVIIIPIAVSVHTVVSFIFSMTIQPMWHSTILGPYFVIGAIFTGIASLLVAMAILRKIYHLEEYLKPIHFENLAKLLVVMALLWAYATLAEYLTTFYGDEPAHMSVFYTKFTGDYAPIFWTMVVCCFVVPMPILCFHRLRTITGCVIASVSINVGMWLERYTIVVPTLTNPRLPYQVQLYHPSSVEIAITVASFAMLVLLYAIFVKLFPVVSIWEVREGRELEGLPQAPAGTSPGVEVGALTMKSEYSLEVGTLSETMSDSASQQAEFYFRIHIMLIMAVVCFYAIAIGWLAWCLVGGGGFEYVLASLVIVVLLLIMLVSVRSMVIIACDGRPRVRKVEFIRAQRKTVSADEWKVQSAGRLGKHF